MRLGIKPMTSHSRGDCLTTEPLLRPSSVPTFSYFSYFFLLFLSLPTFSYFFLKNSYYSYF